MRVIFEDDMMELKKLFIIMIVLSCLMMAWPIVAYLYNMIMLQGLIKMIILGMLLLLYSLYSFLYMIKYRVTICDDILTVRSLFKTHTIELSKGLECEEKKKLTSKYSLIVVSVNGTRINVRTKKQTELLAVLSKYVDDETAIKTNFETQN